MQKRRWASLVYYWRSFAGVGRWHHPTLFLILEGHASLVQTGLVLWEGLDAVAPLKGCAAEFQDKPRNGPQTSCVESLVRYLVPCHTEIQRWRRNGGWDTNEANEARVPDPELDSVVRPEEEGFN